ncbi:hypothetical protein [Alkalihalobacillus sp. TS-13]|uniref:hypothetical protein n=1 Tax=Alkalihalobacillus sp. TS-13 TaxID=2842455 RepID=UPI001C86ADC4|nr:hypothetical protein [Alkalihalobacillus sp. TS-13]
MWIYRFRRLMHKFTYNQKDRATILYLGWPLCLLVPINRETSGFSSRSYFISWFR